MTPQPMAPQSIKPPLRFTVRRVIRRYGPALGNLRHIASNRPNRWALAVSVPFIGFFAIILFIGSALGNATYASSIGVSIFFALFYWFAVAYMGSEKVLVFDRGVVVGNFQLWHKQRVVLWENMSPETLRTYTKIRRVANATGVGLSPTWRFTFWTQKGIGFSGSASRDAKGRDPSRVFEGVTREQQWLLCTSGSPERLCMAIREAMVAVGVPDAWNRTQYSLPSMELTGKIEDLAWQMPGLAPLAHEVMNRKKP